MIAILDPGIGNLSSLISGFGRVDTETIVIRNADEWHALVEGHEPVSGVVLPGVGAFGDAMFQMRAAGLIGVVRQIAREGRPLFGICLGMQLLFGQSHEHGQHVGLGLLKGEVVRFRESVGKVPHMGWNSFVDVATDHPLLEGISVGDYVYFVHSYYVDAKTNDHVLAKATYGDTEVAAVVGQGMVMGTQFHPEKSGEVGERILRNFVTLCRQYEKGDVSRA